MQYNVGDIVRLKDTLDTAIAVTQTPKRYAAGTEGIVIADCNCPSVLFHDGTYIRLSGNCHVEGYNPQGIAAWLWYSLSKRLQLDDIFEEYDLGMNDFVNSIVACLKDLGFTEGDRKGHEN